MALSKPSPLSIVLAVLFLALCGYLAWQSTTKENAENYTKGASHNEFTSTVAPTIHAYPLSCSRFIIQPDGTYKDEMKERANKKVTK